VFCTLPITEMSVDRNWVWKSALELEMSNDVSSISDEAKPFVLA